MDDLADHPLVSSHRGGVGLLGAVVLDPERLAADPTLADRAYTAVRDNGLISRVIAGDSLQISPPLVITESELDELASLMRTGLDEVS
jgi:adenosylmethionine-8-amino-7-oxononanoate aminotransferase